MTSTPSPNASNVRRQAFLRQASTPVIDSKKPTLVPRWLHAQEIGKGWTTFGLQNSGHLETAWEAFQKSEGQREMKEAKAGDEQRKLKSAAALAATDREPSATPGEKVQESHDKGKVKANEEDLLEPPDPDTPLPVWRVPVAEDRLFEVDLRTLKYWPVFWKGKGCEVLRGSWFFDSAKISPCTDEVGIELESLYHTIQPWLPSYADELKSAVAIGADAEQKLRAPMRSLKGSYVIFLGPFLARIYSDDVTSRMTKTLWTVWSGAHGGGTLVARGYDNAKRLLRTRENKKATPNSKSTTKSGHRARASTDGKGGSPLTSQVSLSQGTDTSKIEGAAEPTSTEVGATKEEEEAAIVNATASTEAGAADLLRSLTNKFGTWGSSSSKRASQISTKTQNDIKEAFKEAQSRAQGGVLESTRNSLEGMTSTGLLDEAEDGSERDEKDLTAEEEAREDEEELQREKEREECPLELIMVIHGIGQKLAEADNWKSLEFSLAVSSLRVLLHKRQNSAAPSDVGGGGIPELSKGKRVQIIPVLWRATLQDFEPPRPDEQVNPEEHLTNHFSIDDIFSDTIPLIKQLISGILFDIPLYLSQHKEEILNRVVREMNRVYRLFIQRNEKFLANGGQTSLIAHSLGAALAVDILSKQPTNAQPAGALPHPGADLVFNVKNLYLAGSPVALFMWINRAQLIARKGRVNTMNSAIDEALDRSGRWGCMAVDRIFNVFSASDPIGTRLNSTVDATYAKTLKSISLSRAAKSILRTLPGAIEAQQPTAGIFGGWGRSSISNSSLSNLSKEVVEGTASPSDSVLPDEEDVPDNAESLFGEEGKELGGSDRKVKNKEKMISMGKKAKAGFEEKWNEVRVEREKKEVEERKRILEAEKQGKVERNRAERRMEALCEFGSVDFVIPLQTSLLTNQYMEFLWSHAGYWTDVSFADFLLTTLYSSSDQLKEARVNLAKEP